MIRIEADKTEVDVGETVTITGYADRARYIMVYVERDGLNLPYSFLLTRDTGFRAVINPSEWLTAYFDSFTPKSFVLRPYATDVPEWGDPIKVTVRPKTITLWIGVDRNTIRFGESVSVGVEGNPKVTYALHIYAFDTNKRVMGVYPVKLDNGKGGIRISPPDYITDLQAIDCFGNRSNIVRVYVTGIVPLPPRTIAGKIILKVYVDDKEVNPEEYWARRVG